MAIGAQDRQALDRPGRVLLRPPLAKTSLTQEADGSVVFEMKRATADGTAAPTPEELVSRLVAIVPPAGANQIVTRGVLAGNAALRAEVVFQTGFQTDRRIWPAGHRAGAADEAGEGSGEAASRPMG